MNDRNNWFLRALDVIIKDIIQIGSAETSQSAPFIYTLIQVTVRIQLKSLQFRSFNWFISACKHIGGEI